MGVNKTGVVGVWRHITSNTWEAGISIKGKNLYLGRHKEFENAVRMRKEAEKKYYDL